MTQLICILIIMFGVYSINNWREMRVCIFGMHIICFSSMQAALFLAIGDDMMFLASWALASLFAFHWSIKELWQILPQIKDNQ